MISLSKQIVSLAMATFNSAVQTLRYSIRRFKALLQTFNSFKSDIHFKHSIQTFNSDVQFVHSIHTLSSDIHFKHSIPTPVQLGHSIQTFSSDIQLRHSIPTFNSDVRQYQHWSESGHEKVSQVSLVLSVSERARNY